MSIDRLLGSLHHVRALSPGPGYRSWTAACPAHDDKRPSLSIKEFDSGHIVFICRAGCSSESVRAATGIPWSELFPPRPRDTPDGPGGRAPFFQSLRATDLLAAAAHEALIVALSVEAEWRGEDVSLEDQDRMMLAVSRLRQFAEQAA